jgi:hypothetical protein
MRLPRFDAGHEHDKQTNEFAAHEQLRAAAARIRYTVLDRSATMTGKPNIRRYGIEKHH